MCEFDRKYHVTAFGGIIALLKEELVLDTYSFWTDVKLHEKDGQSTRQSSALSKRITPIMLDKESQMCSIKGSGKEAYIVHLESCTCGDFKIRRLPCKHMYRLAHELGVFQLRGTPQIAKIAPFSSGNIVDKFVDIETGKVLEYSNMQAVLERIDKLSPKDLAIVYKYAPRYNTQDDVWGYDHNLISETEDIKLVLFDKEAVTILVDVGLFLLVDETIYKKLGFLRADEIQQVIKLIGKQKTRGAFTNAKSKLAKLNVLTTQFREDLEKLNDELFLLTTVPSLERYYAALHTHAKKNYAKTNLCRACYSKIYVPLNEGDFVETTSYGCNECGGGVQIRVHNSIREPK